MMPTLDDVARLAGVSRMTASNALRGKSYVRPETAAKVLQAARQLKYRPNLAARQLSSGKTNVIGFSTVELDYSPFSADLAAAISDQALAMGYQTLIQQTRHEFRTEMSMMSEISTQYCDGTILAAPTLPVSQIIELNQHYPLVIFDGPDLNGEVDCVLSPSEEGSIDAVEHLISQGCRHILVLGAQPGDEAALNHNVDNGSLRLRGAIRAMDKHGLKQSMEYVQPCSWKYEDGYQALNNWLDSHPDVEIDGIYCITDVVAIGAMMALQQRGIRIPQDVAVIGFDGLEESRFTNPPLSTIAVDVQTVAAQCLRLLTNRMNDGPREQVTLPYELMVRESSTR